MRQVLVFGCALAVTLAACQGGHPTPGVGGLAFDERSNGKTVVLPLNQELTITLTSLGDGGYSNWSVATPPDQETLETTASSHQPGSGLVGDFGKDVFKFRGVKAGQTSILANAGRSFSGETQTYSLTVIVGTDHSAVSGTVVGRAGLPVEGALVMVSGHPAVTTGADGRFAVENVDPAYDVLVGLSQSTFQRAFAAAWLGLHRRDPVLALANDWPQAGAHYATVCGTTSGSVIFPAAAPWIFVDPPSPFGDAPNMFHVDPSSRTYCAGAGWTGPTSSAGSVHVLAVDSVPGAGSDFSASGFPAAGSLFGLALADGVQLAGQDLLLTPAQAVSLSVEASGPSAPGANLFVSAYYGGGWLGRGVPLASQRSGAPWPSVALPVLPDVRVRLTAWSSNASGASWRERSIAPSPTTVSLALPAIPAELSPQPGTVLSVGTSFRWTPAEKDAVFISHILADLSSSSPITELVVYGSSPDLSLPDFSTVGVALPKNTLGSWDARSIGPVADIDGLVTRDHLGLALHHGLGEEEWFTAGSTTSLLAFPP